MRRCLTRWFAFSDAVKRAKAIYRRILLRKKILYFQLWCRGIIGQKRERQAAAILIQSICRGHAVRVEQLRLKKIKDHLIRVIQSRIRAKIARVKVKVKTWKLKVAYSKGATRLQALWRGYLGRRYVWRDMVIGAVLFQAAWRGYCCRRARIQATVPIKVWWTNLLLSKNFLRANAAVRISAVYRGHLARRWLRLNLAATVIAKVYRGYVTRRATRALRSKLQKFWAHLLFKEVAAADGKALDIHAERAIQKGTRLADKVWQRYPCKQIFRLQCDPATDFGRGDVKLPILKGQQTVWGNAKPSHHPGGGKLGLKNDGRGTSHDERDRHSTFVPPQHSFSGSSSVHAYYLSPIRSGRKGPRHDDERRRTKKSSPKRIQRRKKRSLPEPLKKDDFQVVRSRCKRESG